MACLVSVLTASRGARILLDASSENGSALDSSLLLESGRVAGGAAVTLVGGGAGRTAGGARMPDARPAGFPFPNGLSRKTASS